MDIDSGQHQSPRRPNRPCCSRVLSAKCGSSCAAFTGTTNFLHFDRERLSLLCASCGYESPGWSECCSRTAPSHAQPPASVPRSVNPRAQSRTCRTPAPVPVALRAVPLTADHEDPALPLDAQLEIASAVARTPAAARSSSAAGSAIGCGDARRRTSTSRSSGSSRIACSSSWRAVGRVEPVGQSFPVYKVIPRGGGEHRRRAAPTRIEAGDAATRDSRSRAIRPCRSRRPPAGATSPSTPSPGTR